MEKSNKPTPEEMNLANKVCFLVQKMTENVHHVYDNKSLMEKLHIKDKLLKKLRDNGYLGYSRYGDKYWYTQEDVDNFSSVITMPHSLSRMYHLLCRRESYDEL